MRKSKWWKVAFIWKCFNFYNSTMDSAISTASNQEVSKYRARATELLQKLMELQSVAEQSKAASHQAEVGDVERREKMAMESRRTREQVYMRLVGLSGEMEAQLREQRN
jgi:hypothetical protein